MKLASDWRIGIAPLLGTLAVWAVGSVCGAAEPIPLRAGPLSMAFDADNAFLRYVRVGPHEVLLGVNAPVRDRNWGTVRPKVSNVRIDDQRDHFRVEFDATCQQDDIDFRWHGTIVGTQGGEVVFTFAGESHSTFLRNRIGMCVLHSAAAAGKPWIIRHANGEESKGGFPSHISPHQPAKQVRGVSHQVADNIWAHVDMEGDVFEMEDQRNWTDASFKTYCTPLELPFPVEVKKGTKIVHKVRIRVEGATPEAKNAATPPADEPVVLALGKRSTKLPRIGLQVSSEARGLSPRQVERLKSLRLDHLRVDVRLSANDWATKLRDADLQARALGVSLHVGVGLGEQPDAELERLVGELKALSPNVALYVIHVTDWRQFQSARAALEPIRGKARIAASRGDNFVDLNRDRPSEDGLDAVAFAINPQIHAFDDASIVETLPMHAETVRSAREFVGKRSLAVGPVTLRPPLAAPAKGSAAPGATALPADVDARQASPLAAAWTVASLGYLADAGAESVTYFETVGWKGLIDLDRGASRPAGFPAAAGEAFPVYHVFRAVADFAGERGQSLDSSDPRAAVALALKRAGMMHVLAANLTGRRRALVLKDFGLPRKTSLLFDPTAGEKLPSPAISGNAETTELNVTLPPHGVVRMEFEPQE